MDFETTPTLGIIAGYGDLARDVINACQVQGRPYFIVAFEGHTDQNLVKGHPHEWVTLGKVGRTLELLRKHRCDRAMMVGYFNRPSWADIKPDLKGMQLMTKLVGKPMGDDGLFRVIIHFLETEGFTVLSPEDVLQNSPLMPMGCITKRQPDAQALIDIERGLKVARALGTVDVGQAVVVCQGLVLGVEALEGSDRLIERCGLLYKEMLEQKHCTNTASDHVKTDPCGVFVKIVKPQQETRVDRAVVGPNTITAVYKAGLQGIAAEANRVILLNQEESITLANQYNIFITGV